ncbi:DNA repair protein RecN [Paracandidimonas soli]|uniref:DNA repair protein RecN n=1 Tax=Paracandidimonas soli TaxID=1917182 RepID=UPI0033427411
MLRTLHIRDFVIVEEAEIPFESGFTVFSGETGAGKSILIDALSLALGARADASAVRNGAQRADISAVFDIPGKLSDWLEDNDIATEDGMLILRRVIDSQGRSRCYINGGPVTVSQLRELSECLVDIHGQHAHQSLLKASGQRDLLDTQGGHLDLARQVGEAWQRCSQAGKALELAQRDAASLNEERERLEWQLEELSRLALGPDEWQALDSEHSRLSHSQALLDGAGQALNALDDDETSARRLLDAAAHAIQQQLRHDPQLQGVYDAIESARIATAEAASDLNSYLDRLEPDPDRLAQLEQRLSSLFDAARKFRVEPQELPQLQQQLETRLAATQAAGNIEALQQELDAAQAEYRRLAAELGKKRRKTAKQLSALVTQAMQTLAMQGGSFDIALNEAPASSHGLETIEFLVAGHAGTAPRPLAKVASGGELARLSLALSVIASQAARVPTLIFDEVDTGVGGAVAEVVGRLLAELGQRHQVLCVTHLPQVAACGQHHFRVSKQTTDGQTSSSIEPLDDAARTDEIARMLGGLKITETTRRHAREMLGL